MESLTIEEIIALYNPANASKLTPEQINAMKDLTDDQIAALAEAYPNKSFGNAYLVLYDTSEKPEKQKFALATWKNLKNVRDMGRKNFLPYAFKANMPSERAAAVKNTKAPAAGSSRAVDLKKDEKLTGIVTKTGQTGKAADAKDLTGKAADDKNKKAGDIPNIPPASPAGEAGTDGPGANAPAVDETHPLVIAVRTEEKELAQLQEDKAHHMTIKSQEAKVTAAKEAAAVEGIIVPAATPAAPSE